MALPATTALVMGLLLAACGGGGSSSSAPTPPAQASGARTLSGKVTYDFVPAVYNVATRVGGLDFASASARPVRNGRVLILEGATELAATTTDASGNYSTTFIPKGTGALQVAALATSATPSIIVQDNTDSGSPWGISAAVGAGVTTMDLHAGHGWTGSAYNAAARGAAPFAVLDSMYSAARAFLSVRPAAVFPALKVNWSPNNVPQAGNKALGQIGTSHFSPAENQIYVLGKEGADTDEFDSHVIVHEWAHYFESNLSRSDNPGGSHGPGDVLDPRLAFGEGYGNGLAAILLPESVYVDTTWSGGTLRAFGFDAESEPNPTDDPQPSVFSEATVMRVLYDLYDGGANEGFDGVQVGLGAFYDVLVGPEKTTSALTTLGSFITGLKAQAGVNAAAVNTLLAHYQIGPISSPYGDGDPDLRAMYLPVAPPFTGTLSFDGGADSNKWVQNQYFVVTGNGGPITVRSTCSQDVDLFVFKAGQRVASATTTGGNESLSFNTTAAADYVVVVTGFGATPGAYAVELQITTP